MRTPRAPRTKKRLSCEISYNGARYTGFAIDISASGLFVQTNVKPSPGAIVDLRLSVPGLDEPIAMQARVVRKKTVPPQLLALAQGGIGLAITRAADTYLDFVAGLSPEHGEWAARERARRSRNGRPGSRQAGPAGRTGNRGEAAPKRFRVHAVETATGRKNTFLTSCGSEAEAGDQVVKQLGDGWQVLFVERA